MPRRTGVQNGSAISKNMTPTLWLRLLRRNRAMAFGRYPSFFATSSMRFFVAGAMYRASGALFSTIETVAGEKPLDCATSRIVMVWFLPLCRFTPAPPEALSSGVCGSNCNVRSFTGLRVLLRGRFKSHGFAETGCFPRPVKQPCGHPHRSEFFCRHTQLQKNVAANSKAQQRPQNRPNGFPLRPEEVTHKSRCVHAHEGDERSEVEHFRPSFIGEKKRTRQCNRSDQNYVVGRDMPLCFDLAEKSLRERVVAAHAVKQAGRCQLRAHSGADVGDQDGEIQQLK